MHPIKRYCEAHSLTQRVFAARVGLSPSFISQLVLGREHCGRVAGMRIVAATDGEIDLAELLTWDRADASEPAA